MKPLKRSLAAVLALVMLLSLVPMAGAAGTAVYKGVEYSTDYTTWRQGDPAWGNTPLGDVHTFGGSGCLISAIAMLMCHSGAYDPARLNPGLFRDWLDEQGYISHSSDRSKDALLSFGLITKYTSPRFYFVNQEFFSTSTPFDDVVLRVSELLASGYYVVARVKHSGHFVAVANVAMGDVRIFDSGYVSKRLLSEYNGTIGGLICFKANTAGDDTILPDLATPDAPKVAPLAETWGSGDSIPISWSAANLATHYNIYVEQKQADGSWKENVQVHFYAKSPHALNPLPAGSYRVKVQSTNSKNWTYANAPYVYFTVRDGFLTVLYNANGGTSTVQSQLTQKGAAYQLTTPTKSKAAFLGWFTEDGKLVTNDSVIATNKGHTLTAHWDSSAVGFQKSSAYQGQFKDVSKNAWYYDSIASVYAYGLMNGTKTNTFEPNGQILASQAVTLAARMRKLYLTGNGTFSATSPWYKAYSDYALKEGILTTLPKDMEATLTRQEFAAILGNALPDAALPQVNEVANGAIADVYRSDSAIYKLYRAGIFAGNDAQGTFRPNAPITRAEAAAVLVRIADPNSRVLFTLDATSAQKQ